MIKYTAIFIGTLLTTCAVFKKMRNKYRANCEKICNDNVEIFNEKFPVPNNPDDKLQKDSILRERDEAINAFTHCYTSACLTQKYGEFFARKLGDLTETFNFVTGNKIRDSVKDKFNNAVGREIVKKFNSNDIQQACLSACKSDVLINSIFDKRVDSLLNKQIDYKIPPSSIASIMP